ncbi:hypothetical protein MKQ68_10115 [Chitinophaga horti]|uniref:Uncharacterized protein n=1 Tax=Chitinophaga horti TaxID=2920382 RepID=A0ABY6J6Z6_9BACT|nr:hypothetical protein [Chitinophaga horti]UYQ95453.1 hypothetical protein MKQ68_10115 [Chitinophaga horti]
MTDKKHNKETKDEAEDSPVQPDPETLGPDPQENMEGPISSIVKNIAEAGDEEDKEDRENDEEVKHS